jgi:hypothetical protein
LHIVFLHFFRDEILGLLEQGLSADEIKQRLKA